ncbi:MAG: hypothetical protein B6D34_05190 [Candidatus Brocadia sp. UTAMX1]|nr:MAG: hypothetical protein B6D34_05190 [Candidatus Brocadia sp. UTAMX1]
MNFSGDSTFLGMLFFMVFKVPFIVPMFQGRTQKTEKIEQKKIASVKDLVQSGRKSLSEHKTGPDVFRKSVLLGNISDINVC